MSHHDHTSIPTGSVQGLTRPAYTPETWRDYVPPPIFTQVRAPVPVPRADLKDQGPRAASAPITVLPAQGVAPVVRVAPPPAAPGPRHHRTAETDALVRAILDRQPPGAGLTVVGLRTAMPTRTYTTNVVKDALARLRDRGEIEQRDLLNTELGAHRGRVCEYRRTQPGTPWGAPPPGTRLPGQRPPLRPTRRRDA